MDQVHVIRHKVLVEKQGVRRVAREMGVSRNTVKRYLKVAQPVRLETVPRGRPKFAKVAPRLRELLDASPTWTTSKQRLTATRLHQMLVGEGHEIGVTLVKEAVAEWKRQKREVFVPLVYAPGELAQVDFFEVVAVLAAVRVKLWMFLMRLMHSGRDFAGLYTRQDQASFLDGHVRAFEHFGATPQRIAYDNLRLAVRRHLVGSERELTTRFAALASHYLFEPSFCRPATGHDKGGVEARGKGIRLAHLVPIPAADELATIRKGLLENLDAAMTTRRDAQGRTIVEKFAAERAQMIELPSHAFRARITHPQTSVSRRSLITIEGAYYSVPCRWAGLDVDVHVGADDLEIVGPRGATVIRLRKRFGERCIDYRDYIPELAKKPQAVRQVAAELIDDLGEPFGSAWRSLVDAHGPKEAARIFAKVLGHVEERGLAPVAQRITSALRDNEPLLLALAPAHARAAEVAHDALPAALRDVQVAAASAADYDTLLGGGES